MSKIKRICTCKRLTHVAAGEVFRQLKAHPEVCEDCDIKPCVFGLYVFGKELKNELRPTNYSNSSVAGKGE